MMKRRHHPLESALYGLGIAAYAAGVGIASLRLPKARKLREGHRDVWKRLKSRINPADRHIWIHAASLGEFEQARPIIEAIRRDMPGKKIILTFFSPSGYEVRKDYDQADLVCYLPFDSSLNARRFIRMTNPEMAIFVKYEIWRNYLTELRRHDIPAYLVSAAFRPDQAFFKPWGHNYARWLKLFTKIFVQDPLSADLLRKVGIDDAIVAGDTRFDRVAEIRSRARSLPSIAGFAESRPADSLLMVAGSSWQPDEEAYIPWLHGHPGARAIIAPHEFDPARLSALKDRLGKGALLYSELIGNPERAREARYLVIDCFGLLSSIYRFADFAVIGGGFGAGIHNINEAAVYDIPVVFGPNYHRFVEAEELIEAGGALSYSSPEEFATIADSLADDAEARKDRGRTAGNYIRSKLGATGRILSHLFPA